MPVTLPVLASPTSWGRFVAWISLLATSVPAAAQTFSDQTSAQGIVFAHRRAIGDPMPLGAGGALGDFDGDGWLDFFAANARGSNKLFRNLGNGLGFTDVAVAYGLEGAADHSTGALFGDYDNDGDQDLYVMNRGNNILFRNEGPDGSGGWTFTDVTATTGGAAFGRTSAACYGDYDNDGFLDLYVSNHSYAYAAPSPGDPFHADFLYHNVAGPGGERIFEDVTSLLDPSVLAVSLAHSVGFIDHDNDGDLDIYVVNEDMSNLDPALTGENLLWRNDGSDGSGGWIFTEVAASVIPEHGHQPMGLAIGDYNADGWLDMAFSDNGPNHLLQNSSGTFTDVAVAAGVDRPTVPGLGHGQVTWGLCFLDCDLDGDEDLYIGGGGANPQPNPLFSNNADFPNCTFTDVSSTSGADDARSARTVLRGDYDNDGDEDLFVVNINDDAFVLRNDQSGGDFFVLRLVGSLSNRDAIGARVHLSASGLSDQYRMVQSGSTTGGGHTKKLHFGVTGASIIDSITIDWPSGQQTSLSNVSINQELTIVEPCPVVATNYGAGVAGTLGVPALTADTSPASGQDVEVHVGNSAGSASIGLLFVGLSSAAIPGFFGGDLLVQPAIVTFLPLPAAGLNLANPHPEEPVCGITAYLQIVELDPGGPAGFSASQGLQLDLGL